MGLVGAEEDALDPLESLLYPVDVLHELLFPPETREEPREEALPSPSPGEQREGEKESEVQTPVEEEEDEAKVGCEGGEGETSGRSEDVVVGTLEDLGASADEDHEVGHVVARARDRGRVHIEETAPFRGDALRLCVVEGAGEVLSGSEPVPNLPDLPDSDEVGGVDCEREENVFFETGDRLLLLAGVEVKREGVGGLGEVGGSEVLVEGALVEDFGERGVGAPRGQPATREGDLYVVFGRGRRRRSRIEGEEVDDDVGGEDEEAGCVLDGVGDGLVGEAFEGVGEFG